MQKKLIALAVVAAFSAPAFADVTTYGVVDAAVVHVTADGQRSDLQVVSGGLSQSRLGVKAVEDIGDMKAVVVLEYGLDTANDSGVGVTQVPALGTIAAGFSARQQMLALAGGFGTAAAGFLQTTGYDWAVKFDPTAGSAVSPLQSVTGGFLIGSNTVASRAQRALAYISPNMSGATVAVNYSTDTGLNRTGTGSGLGNLAQPAGGPDKKVPAYLVSVNYDLNALSLGAVYAKASNNEAAVDITDWSVGASYDFGVAKVLGTYQSSKVGSSNANKAYSLSGVAPVGPGAVLVTYAKNSMAAASSSASGYTVGYLQGLSKVTTAYVTVTRIQQDAGTNAYGVLNNAIAGFGTLTAGGSSTMLALGLNKKF